MRGRPRLFGDESDRAVSPVVGVILMVAITVILAAVVAGVMMGFTDGLGEPAPTTSLAVTSEGSGAVVVQHRSGDGLDVNELTIVAYDSSGASVDSATVGSLAYAGVGGDGRVDPGDSLELSYSPSSSGGDSIDEVRIIHDPSDTPVMSHSSTIDDWGDGTADGTWDT